LRGDAVEFGCGGGTFSIPAARRISSTPYTLDIDPLMVTASAVPIRQVGLDL
jgi:ribosomal protein L11 methylase PrmA